MDPNVVYGLADLIDFAHRTNPETRRAWEEARAAAAQVARAEAAYYPTLFLLAVSGTSRVADRAVPPIGTFTVTEGRALTRNCSSSGSCSILAAEAPVLSVAPRSSSKQISRSTELREIGIAVSATTSASTPAGRA